MKNITVLVSGSGSNLQRIIDCIDNGEIPNAKVNLVVADRDCYALERAKNHNIPFQLIKRGKEFSKNLDKILPENTDLIVLAGFLSILQSEFCEKYKGKIINIHPALIPSFCGTGYYGLKVHEGVLKRGVKVTGATVHFVDEGTDTGPIILQKAVEVKEGDTPEILQRRVMEEAEWVIMPKAIDLIANDKIEVVDGLVRSR